VPYAPPVFLSINDGGIREDDFAFILAIRRDRPLCQLLRHREMKSTSILADRQARGGHGDLRDFAGRSEEYKLRLAERMASLAIPSSTATACATDSPVRRPRAKQAQESELTDFLRRDPSWSGASATCSPSRVRLRRKVQDPRKDGALMGRNWGGDLFGMASQICKWSVEREKPDLERERAIRRRRRSRRERLEYAQINLLPKWTRADAPLAPPLPRAAADQRIAVIDSLCGGKTGARRSPPGRLAESGLRRSRLAIRRAACMFAMKKAELTRWGSLHRPGHGLEPEMEAVRERGKWFRRAVAPGAKLIAAYAAFRGAALPDANFTLRFNHATSKAMSTEDPSTTTSRPWRAPAQGDRRRALHRAEPQARPCGGRFLAYVDAPRGTCPSIS